MFFSVRRSAPSARPAPYSLGGLAAPGPTNHELFFWIITSSSFSFHDDDLIIWLWILSIAVGFAVGIMRIPMKMLTEKNLNLSRKNMTRRRMKYYHPTSKNQCSNSLALPSLPLSDPMKLTKTKYFYAVPTKEFEKIKLIFVPNFGFANLVITNLHQIITH